MVKTRFTLLLLAAVTAACDPNVVDAVREPPPTPVPVPVSVSPLRSSLLHRYSFDEKGSVALDSKGAAHGQVLGTKLAGDGSLPLAGDRTGQYVNLPNGLVSGLTEATFEAWLTWSGGGPWQRIFDFGNNSSGEDVQGSSGTSYLFLTTASSLDFRKLDPTLRLAYSQNGVVDEDICNGPGPLPTGVEMHVAVVIDPSIESMALYQNGALLADCFLARPLSAIDDENDWLGHSNFAADVDLTGVFDEFRVYGAALSAQQIADSFAAGPDAKP